MKTIQTNNYDKIEKTASIDSVLRLVQKGLSINTAIEQVYGVGKLNSSQIEDIKRQVNKKKSRAIPIRSF